MGLSVYYTVPLSFSLRMLRKSKRAENLVIEMPGRPYLRFLVSSVFQRCFEGFGFQFWQYWHFPAPL
jgi:hypothetical protein